MNNDITSLLDEVYTLCAQGRQQKAMELLFTEVHMLLSQDAYQDADALLGAFDVGKCPFIVGVGLLRASFAVRHQLQKWESLRERLGECYPMEAKRFTQGLE